MKSKTNAIKAVEDWLDWAARSLSGPMVLKKENIPCGQIVDDVLLAYGGAIQPDKNGWLPIDSLPEGRHVLLYWPNGERGNGGIECGMVFFGDGDWNYWTHGGPNSGSDWEPRDGERPTLWMPYIWPQS